MAVTFEDKFQDPINTSSPALSLIKAYENSKREQEKIRIYNQEWLWDYYEGDKYIIEAYLKSVVEKILGSDIVKDDEWLYDWVNITKKVIDRLAVVYLNAPDRYIEAEYESEDMPKTEYFESILPENLNSIDKKQHRIAKLQNTSLTFLYFDKNTGKIAMRVEPSHKYQVEVDDNDPYLLTKVSYRKYFKNRITGEDELFTVVWTKDDHYKLDGDEKKSPVGDNEGLKNPWRNKKGEGVLPFAKNSLVEGEDVWGVGQYDLVNVNEMINFLLTFLINDAIVLGSTGTPLGINLNLNKRGVEENGQRKVRTGRRHPISIDDVKTDDATPSLQYVSTQPLIAEIQNSIDYRIKQIAVLKGLNPNTILSTVKDTSDYQKMMDSLEQIEIRRDDIEPCRIYEEQRFEIIKAINNTAARDSKLRGEFKLQEINWDDKLVVDFIEPKTELTLTGKWLDREKKLAMNLITPLDILMEENPDLDTETAQELLDANKQINDSNTQKVGRLENLLNNQKEQTQ